MSLFKFLISVARSTFAFAVLASAGAGLSVSALLALINETLHNPDTISGFSVMLYAVLISLVVTLKVGSSILLTQLSQESMALLRMRLSQEILKSPLINLEKYGPHKLLATLSTDITSISAGIMRLPMLFTHSAILFGCLSYLLWLSWWMFGLALIIMILGSQAYRIPQKKGMTYFKRVRKSEDELYKGFRAICEGTKELKMHKARRFDFLDNTLKHVIENLSKHRVLATKYYSVANSFGILLFFIVIGFVVLAVPVWTEIETATLVGYVIVLLFMQGPLEGIMNAIPELVKTSVSLEKIQTLGFELNPKVTNKVAKTESTPVSEQDLNYCSEIKLHNVTHRYYREKEDSYFELGPVNLSFKPGELVFLIGGNGSGKTTLAKLLLGLYLPDTGCISVDGKQLAEYDYESYRQLFSPVFVDFFLFDKLMGFNSNDIDERAQYYLEKLQLAHKVKIENGGISTINLSQGQKKRLTLLAGYLEDRPFYVFDEWAADQDPEFKKVFYRMILPELKQKGKTVVVISHDEQYFDVADRYIKIDSGQIQ